MRTDKTITKLTDTTLITPRRIHTNRTKHQNKTKQDVIYRTYTSFEAIFLKLIFTYH